MTTPSASPPAQAASASPEWPVRSLVVCTTTIGWKCSLLAEIRRSAERPTLRDLRARLQQRTPVVPDVSPAEVIRELRDQP